MTTTKPEGINIEDDRTGTSIETLKRAFLDNLFYIQVKFPKVATKNDYYLALAYTVRDRLATRWLNTSKAYFEKTPKIVTYLSAEFLLGRHLRNNLYNLGLYDTMKEVMEELGLDLHDLIEQEEEPGLGNGGLGRLAACYIDSMATLEIPAIGYGIRYEYGIFDQDIVDGWQVEVTDKWLQYGNPWEVARPEEQVEIKFGGHTEYYKDEYGRLRMRWMPSKVVTAVPYDTPIVGYGTNTVNTLRLWKAEAPESFDFEAFNQGEYFRAVEAKTQCENITKVLYPNDETYEGKVLRLEQQFFFVSASLQDMIRMMKVKNVALERFHEQFTVQLNDTHPTIAVPELMRLLIDEHGFDWNKAWSITTQTLAYTNHTLLPEALERWNLPKFASLFPRHLEIIYEINRRFIDEVRIKFPDDVDRIRRMSIIDETGEKYVRMANLASVAAYRINGVAAMHTELLKSTVLHDFYEMYPSKFVNVTNGVTPRRFITQTNYRLTDLITSKIGYGWIKNLGELQKIEGFADDADFRSEFRRIKRDNKQDLVDHIRKNYNIEMNPDSVFDILIKRIHEYKRQHLKALYIINQYNRIKANPDMDIVPRTHIFGGKAAPGYYKAKLIIKLINAIGEVVNYDPDVRGRIKVLFMKDYNVSFSQRLFPASDISEQISTAGYEASGTGNMKFAMNGALTVGTLDGANVEIREKAGAENFFLFGLTVEEVAAKRAAGYNPNEYYQNNEELQLVMHRISSGFFSHGDMNLFKPLVDSLLYEDKYMLMADFQSYIDAQDQADKVYRDQDLWSRMAILNVARMGFFSSDRSINDYRERIWKTPSVKVEIPDYSQSNFDLNLG
ncbi:glycogen/starch/alpha-glucan phosphorylase [Gloeocapsa sp. PCC 73106]|uniref:glycogen/starch/alpha-glucan phosphorylase n=1 Tax=Gloeocapsa sp. PCC 73106 TaxID=102232 RepID=UPI0002ACA165|nr:glycogen/starch/alpha-glucan phosphorylase [Gloeocapsa sp. PCC 73106]ELR97061.1 glycogen/starch/alpha-glucan phosphorylase [Gloeocapsa sp. PCC 73106]